MKWPVFSFATSANWFDCCWAKNKKTAHRKILFLANKLFTLVKHYRVWIDSKSENVKRQFTFYKLYKRKSPKSERKYQKARSLIFLGSCSPTGSCVIQAEAFSSAFPFAFSFCIAKKNKEKDLSTQGVKFEHTSILTELKIPILFASHQKYVSIFLTVYH